MSDLIVSKDCFGSRMRCLTLTGLPKSEAAALLTKICNSFATVPEDAVWIPKGFRHPQEAELDKISPVLTETQQQELTRWWRVHTRGGNNPNWDIVSECVVEGKKALLLVEAKAHRTELDTNEKPNGTQGSARSRENHDQIAANIKEANDELESASGVNGWNLSVTQCYQLANRFTWAWKVASLGVPVVLVYLGYLNAADMSKNGEPFSSAEEWIQSVHKYAQGLVPEQAWERRIEISGIPLYATVSSLELTFR